MLGGPSDKEPMDPVHTVPDHQLISSTPKRIKGVNRYSGEYMDESSDNAMPSNTKLNQPSSLDQFEAFGHYVACKLQALSFQQRVYAERMVHEVLLEAELGKLRRNSHIFSAPSQENSATNTQSPSRSLNAGVELVDADSQIDEDRVLTVSNPFTMNLTEFKSEKQNPIVVHSQPLNPEIIVPKRKLRKIKEEITL